MIKLRLLLLLFLFSNLTFAQKSDTHLKGLSRHSNLPSDEKITDSLLLVKYTNEVIRSNASPEDSLLPIDDVLNSLGNFRIDEQKITYAPDSSFKIVTIVVEDCGAYCNSQWYSWVHFNLKDNEQIKQVDFFNIDTIYQLPDNKYLIIGSHGHRPAGVLTIFCITPQLISLTDDSLFIHTIEYKHKNIHTESNGFSFCQENGVDIDNEPFVRYDGSDKMLRYHFANNYSYSNDLDIDTIRQGEFRYINGSFILETETIKVNDNRRLPIETKVWTEAYENHDSDSANIHIANINGHQLVYDCIGTNVQPCSDTIIVSSISNNIKKKLLNLPTNGAYLEDIYLIKINEKDFLYILTNETSGNSDGYLYFLNSKTITVHEVKVEKPNQKLPTGCVPWGSYAYLVMNEDHSQIYTLSQFIDTKKENRKGRILTHYTLHKTNNNQFILKRTKSEVSFDE